MVLNQALWHLLHLLADGQYHSGQALGCLLGVSRAAVWKHLQGLQALGLQFERRRGKGYRWLAPFNPLDTAQIQAALSPQAKPLLQELQVLLSVDSTNSALLRQAAQGPIAGKVLLAEQQTQGKGRRGRTWLSPVSGNVYLSLGGQFEQGVAPLEGLSLAVAVVVAEALGAMGVQGLGLKWPNDLLLEGSKLGGILLEIGGDLNGQGYLVVGLGLNYALCPQTTEPQWQPWASLAQQLPPSARNRLVATFISALLQLLASYSTTGFAPYKARWEALNVYFGQTIHVVHGNQAFIGVCQQLSANGGLQVDTPEGRVVLQGGEISLRSTHDTGL